jgi:hypothetical protein
LLLAVGEALEKPWKFEEWAKPRLLQCLGKEDPVLLKVLFPEKTHALWLQDVHRD